jgi:hypothetical protein
VAWSKSAIFRAWLECALAPVPGFTGGWNLPAPVPDQVGDFRCSLWKDRPGFTPDETAPLAETGLAAPGSVWEDYPGDGMDSARPPNTGPAANAWPAGGPMITGTGRGGGFDSAGGLITFGGDNAVSAGPCTMSLIFGDMVWHFGADALATVFYQGVCFHYYGGETDVTDGTFTVVWPPERIAQIQLA